MLQLMQEIDRYCERTQTGLLAEPLNFLSNIAFILAAVIVYRDLKNSGSALKPNERYLLMLLFLIGLGSAAFHSFATRWAELCDVGFIAAYVVYFLGNWSRQILGLERRQTLWLFLLFVGLSALSSLVFIDAKLYGSQGYFGVVIFLFGLAWHQQKYLSGSRSLLWASLIFTLALALRTLDEPLCQYFPVGTHFSWHILNAVVCYMTLRAFKIEKNAKSGGQ